MVTDQEQRNNLIFEFARFRSGMRYPDHMERAGMKGMHATYSYSAIGDREERLPTKRGRVAGQIPSDP